MPWLSIIPPLVAVIGTFKTKKLIPSLFMGVVTGSIIGSHSVFGGLIAVGQYIVDALANKESLYTLGFIIAFGALADLIQMAGGISGFSEQIGKWVKTEKGVFVSTWFLSGITFFDTSFHIIGVGTIMRPLLEKVKGSKEKFAFLLSVTSLQLIELIPVATGFMGYMVTLVNNNMRGKGFTESAYMVFIKSILWNFFPWIMIFIAVGVTFWGLWFGKIKIGKVRGEEEFTQKHIEKEECERRDGAEYPDKSQNLIIPVAVLLVSTLFFFWWTGKEHSSTFWGAFSTAKYNVSILTGALFTLFLTSLFFLFQGISLAEIDAHIAKGGEKVLSLVIILILSWALTLVTQELGFNSLFQAGFISHMPKFLIPAGIFLISAVIAYTVGSSWATWALVMPLAMTFAVNYEINPALLVGTVWSGGAVADIISPLSAQVADISFGRHLTTSFPYLIAGVVFTVLGYLTVGLTLLN